MIAFDLNSLVPLLNRCCRWIDIELRHVVRVPLAFAPASMRREMAFQKTGSDMNQTKMFVPLTVTCLFLVFLVTGCSSQNPSEYTLYRTGVDLRSNFHDETRRIYIATFSDNDFRYNLANCEFAQELFAKAQPHYAGSIYAKIKIRYWCEKGSFKG